MKFFLVKDGDPVSIPWRGMHTFKHQQPAGYEYICGSLMIHKAGTRVTPICHRSDIRKVNIISVNSEPWETKKCAQLKKFLEAGNSSDRDGFWSCRVDVGLSGLLNPGNSHDRCGSLEIIKGDKIEKDCLSLLAESFEGAKIQVNWDMIVDEAIVCKMSSAEMKLDGLLIHQDWHISFPEERFGKWRIPIPCYGILSRITITVTIPDPIFYTCCWSRLPPASPMSLTSLEQEVSRRPFDMTISCGDGTEIKAHRNFLAARSPVFLAMFETDMKEARESVVEIPDMEAKSVRVFLKFLYCGDTQDAEEDVHMAVELFQAGHKYGIEFLEEQMRALIMGKPNDWFDLDAVVWIFMFARNLTPTDEGLKRRMGKVLELYSDTLEESPVMQELFRTNYKAALELLKYASMRDSNTR